MNELPDHRSIAIVLVEDDADLREEIAEVLAERGFDVRSFPGSRELYRALMLRPCDIAILDIGLPGEDGLSIMEHLRLSTHAGIIMLTARGQTEDRVRALRGGADIYLVKPVDLEELVANIISLARRLSAAPATAGKNEPPAWRLSAGGWVLLAPGGGMVPLSASERTLLQALMHQAGETVTRETLVDAFGRQADDVFSNRLDMLISRLRRKVLSTTSEALPLYAVRGVGFSIVPMPGAEG